MSLHLKKVVETTKNEWGDWRAKKKSEMFFSTYSIDREILERTVHFIDLISFRIINFI